MIKLDKPNVIFKDHFENCIENKHEPLKTNLQNCFGVIEKVANEYDKKAITCQLFQLKALSSKDLGLINRSDLRKLYSEKMVNKNQPGRRVFDEIVASNNEICSFCDHGTARTLDHYLPKSEYPEFAIFPFNLIPCCRDCNSEKNTHNADCEEKQYLHPYYDDVSLIRWLKAEVRYTQTNSPVFRFFVNKNADGMDKVICARIETQFDGLKLDKLFSIQAASALSKIEAYLKNNFMGSSDVQLKSYLNGIAESHSVPNQNSWQAAMYRSMASNDQFCKLSWVI